MKLTAAMIATLSLINTTFAQGQHTQREEIGTYADNK